jgi:hypothetical protein
MKRPSIIFALILASSFSLATSSFGKGFKPCMEKPVFEKPLVEQPNFPTHYRERIWVENLVIEQPVFEEKQAPLAKVEKFQPYKPTFERPYLDIKCSRAPRIKPARAYRNTSSVIKVSVAPVRVTNSDCGCGSTSFTESRKVTSAR